MNSISEVTIALIMFGFILLDGILTFVIGFLGFGVLIFLIMAFFSKATGMTIKNSGIVSGGDTLMTPDGFDNMARTLRSTVDKKYKIKKQLEDEENAEIEKETTRYEHLSYRFSWIAVSEFFTHSCYNSSEDNEILNALDFQFDETSPKDLTQRKLSAEELKRLQNIRIQIHHEKLAIIDSIKKKYQNKFEELSKYL